MVKGLSCDDTEKVDSEISDKKVTCGDRGYKGSFLPDGAGERSGF